MAAQCEEKGITYQNVEREVEDEILSFLAMASQRCGSEKEGGPEHREKIHAMLQPGTPVWNALVTLALSPKDPRSRNAPALKAINKELENLRAENTWDEEHPMEEEDAKVRYPNAHFARIFPLVGIKNYEDADQAQHVYKGRIVFRGDQVRVETGYYAVFND